MTLSHRAVAEFLGSPFLLAAVVGSGIMGQKLAGGNIGIALLANKLATGPIGSRRPLLCQSGGKACTSVHGYICRNSSSDTPGFVASQLLGALAATVPFRWLVPSLPSEAKDVVLPHLHADRE